MNKIGLLDLKILYLGIRGESNTFDEHDLEASDIKDAGVGRILDTLASLREKKLVDMTDNGEFCVTNVAKNLLWNKELPLWLRILRLLDIKSFNIDEISKYLVEPIHAAQESIEVLRKNQLILREPIRRKDGKLEKVFEILQEGRDEIKRIEREGYSDNAALLMNNKNQHRYHNTEILQLIDELVVEIQNESTLSEDKRHSFVERLSKVKERLGI